MFLKENSVDDFDKQLDDLFKTTKTSRISELSEALGVSPTTIRTWRGRNKIPASAFRKAELSIQNDSDVKTDTRISLSFYEISASAGGGALVEVEEQANLISFEPEWLNKEIGVNANDVFLMLVDGDSMYPTLKNGAMIMVNKHFNGLSDGIYVMRHEQNLLVKRLQMLPNGIIKVKSDNNLYEPWEINKENLDGTDIEIIGRVVWSGQRM
ncbi:putative transcriptional regulator [Colwellia psychrerythraea 34H]|uniref:Putative transcriptional regulator n=1 Tax=Colwellia psychrerythraea (strain 34H / ATCC BAA-681) TaxID=167879 RepID=Q489Y6_COLP3|nr:putative transcriptional regulator [Colwellia psychrerythraea 34H]